VARPGDAARIALSAQPIRGEAVFGGMDRSSWIGLGLLAALTAAGCRRSGEVPGEVVGWVADRDGGALVGLDDELFVVARLEVRSPVALWTEGEGTVVLEAVDGSPRGRHCRREFGLQSDGEWGLGPSLEWTAQDRARIRPAAAEPPGELLAAATATFVGEGSPVGFLELDGGRWWVLWPGFVVRAELRAEARGGPELEQSPFAPGSHRNRVRFGPTQGGFATLSAAVRAVRRRAPAAVPPRPGTSRRGRAGRAARAA
jgi:hypothetical protein